MIISFLLFGTILSLKNRKNMFPVVYEKVRAKIGFLNRF